MMEPNISGGFNISLGEDDITTTANIESPQYSPANWLALLCLTVMSLFSMEAGVQIYQKNKNDLEPIYIFEINTLASITAFFLCNAYTVMEVEFLCSIRNGLANYFRLNIFVGIMLSQADRFFALYWHAKYRQRVTPQLAQESLALQVAVRVKNVPFSRDLSSCLNYF